MYDKFRWTWASVRRNGATMEYEPVQPFFFMALAEKMKCGTFLDVGANIGVYSLFGTLIPSIERILAFEPNPDAASELLVNVALNNLQDRIEVHQKAVSSSAGSLSFGVVSKLSGANSIVDTTIHKRASFRKMLNVESITLDGLFTHPLPHSLCIKVDVEGHESEVIDGATALLSSNQVIVQIEAYQDAESARRLKKLGFFSITAVGPDHYFSNIDSLRDPVNVVEIYELATRELIAYNHRNNAVMLKRGDIALLLTGKTGNFARVLANRFIGQRL
jgi:FkbM family methyltransferase